MSITPLLPRLRPAGDMLTAHLLALLKEWTAYGYDLVQRLEEAGYGGFNSGSIYRCLRQMERMGLVSSAWQESSSGPARRMYTITTAGSIFLEQWLMLLEQHRQQIELLLGGMATSEPRESTPSATGSAEP